MKNKRKLRLAALLAVLLLLFPAFAVEDDITDESDTATTQTEETDQTAQLGGTDSIDPSADKPRVFDYEEVLTQTQIDTLEEKTRAIAEKYSIGVGIITIDDYTPYGDGAYDAAEQLYNELDLGASEDGDGVALLISLDDRDFATYAHGAKAEEIFSDAVQQDLEQYFLDNFGNDDWYGGFSDFVSGCEWYLQHVAEGGEAGVPVHNEVEISDSTQEDTADDSFFARRCIRPVAAHFVRGGADRVHGVSFADEIRAYTDNRKPVCGKRRSQSDAQPRYLPLYLAEAAADSAE